MKGPYWGGRVLRIKCTKKDSDISTLSFFNWATMFLISMMCLHTLLVLVSFRDVNFIIRVLAKAISEVTNCSSIALRNLRTFSCCLIEPRIPTLIFVLMYITLRRLHFSQHLYNRISSGVLVSMILYGSSFLMEYFMSMHPNWRRILSFHILKLSPLSSGTSQLISDILGKTAQKDYKLIKIWGFNLNSCFTNVEHT